MLKTSIELYNKLIREGKTKEAERVMARRPEIAEHINKEKPAKEETEKKGKKGKFK